MKVMFREILMRTPVDTGHLAGNWHVSIGGDSTATFGSKLAPRSRAAALGDAVRAINTVNFKGNIDIHFVNNTEYAPVAEYGLWNGPTAKVTSDGFSRQAPSGMLRSTLADFERRLARAMK
jgi:hypothetical protein